MRVFASVVLFLGLLVPASVNAAPLASPYSISIYPAQTFTASNQTGTSIALNGLTVPSTVGSSFASGIITVTGTSLTTATFTVMGSSDGGGTYFALPIINPLAAPSSSAPATAVTVTANGVYMVSLAGITHVQFVTSSAFTATALSLTLTASPNAQVSQNKGAGGSFTPPSGSGNQIYATPANGSSGPAALRATVPADLPAATASTLGAIKPDGSTCTVTAGVLTCTGGTGGGGSVGTGPNGAVGGYVNAGTGNGVLPLPKLYYINQTMTLTQINAVFAAADVHSIVMIGEDVPLNLQWSNPNGARVHDLRKGMNPYSYAQGGVACDYINSIQDLTITAGSNTVNIGALPYPVGGNLVFAKKTGFGMNAVQQAWEPKIIGFANPIATLSGPAPFSYTGPVGYGTINTIPMNALFAAAGANAIQLPSGCRALTGAINWPGTSIIGSGFSTSGLVGLPGQDILVATNGQASVSGIVTPNFTLALDTTFDTTLGYTQWSTDGATSIVIPPVFRPALNNTLLANKPLFEQWSTGGQNGVAAITGGSAVMCVPNVLTRTPANGQLIVFPYLPISTLFNTTVLNQTGAGCAGGSTGVTLNAAVPTLPAPTATILNTTFTEGAASAPLAGTTPSTCASGCVGPWTLAGGPDWTYNGGGGGITQASVQTNPDLITVGTPANYTVTMVLGQLPTAQQISLYAEYADANDTLQISIFQGFAIQCFQFVSGVRTSVCTALGAPTAGTYTLTFTGSNFTLTTPVGTTSGALTVSGNKIGLQNSAATSIVTSLNVTAQLYNFNQAYYENATAFDVGNTTIGTSISYPLTITDSLIKAPTPRGTFSSPMGHVIIGNNSVRMEANYLGNNYSATPGSGQITLREGPATIGSALTAGNYFIIPANPCTAQYETPPFVLPNINGANSVTPAGAVDIPGDCVGNTAMAFTQPDGTHPFGGAVDSFLGPIRVQSSTGVNQGQNRSAARLEQGNTNGYSVAWPGWKIDQIEYGFVQGPASFNEFGVGAVTPNSINDSITNCQIHAAYPLVFTFWQQSIIDGCDTYTTFYNPYDGTAVGAWTALSMSHAVSEQTGVAVTFSSQNHTTRWQAEPENGSHIASAPYSFLECPNCVFDTDIFEGGFNTFIGPNLTVQNSAISLPVIDYTTVSKFTNNSGVNPYYFTNNWADNVTQWFNWGGGTSTCDVLMTGQGSQPCASSYSMVITGKSGASSVTGINGVENIEGGNIRPGEMSFNTGFQLPVFDPTEPYWGKYVGCFNVGSACEEDFFGGNSRLYIGPHNRIAPIIYNLEVTVKQTTGSAGTFQFLFGAQDDGRGTCASVGQFGTQTVSIDTTWKTQTVAVDFTGRQGCLMQFIVQTLANPVLLGEINFIPQSNSINISPPSDSIYNTSCKPFGRQYGVSSTGYSYACVAGTVKRFGPAS